MKVAFVFAHPDDESLSSGGTIAKYARTGNTVYSVCFSSSPERKREYTEAVKILGCKESLIYNYENVVNFEKEITIDFISFLLEFQPEIIVTHLEDDYHIDHRICYKIVREGIEWAAHETQYENPHLVSKLYVTETTILIPNPHILIDITDYYDIKESAMKCYKSQLYKGGENFYIRFHKYRTLMRGTQASTKYAEAFSQIPLKKNSPFYKTKHSGL